MNETTKAKIREIWTAVEERMLNAWGRWQDERGYEEIADYGALFQPDVEAAGGTWGKMLARPFGFKFTLDGFEVQIKLTSREYVWLAKAVKA